MYQHILVPLDGSTLSEAGLTAAEGLAQALKARLLLVRAVNVPATVMAATGADAGIVAPELLEDAIEGEEDDARDYLKRLADRLKGSGLDVAWEVVEGEPARAIVDTAHKEGCDLIAIATHGRTGILRAVLGSVADRVVRESHLPVLLVRPPDGRS
jgi:nucleotide-binding universal stress UspA family protein